VILQKQLPNCLTPVVKLQSIVLTCGQMTKNARDLNTMRRKKQQFFSVRIENLQ